LDKKALKQLVMSATILATMPEMTERPERKPAPSKRKAALPQKKAKRKAVKASRKSNRK
jgi:hypothetical protein